MDPIASRTIGPYRIVASLGRGGQADVYLAVRSGPAGFSKLIVVKSIRHEMEHDPRFRDALIAEARLAAKLQHPNVVQTLEVGEESGQLYMAMEFLDGQPLSNVVRIASRSSKPLEAPLVATILTEMLAGLGAAHELKDFDGRPLEVVHRDLSPQNVFLTYQGEVKLIDFGIAKAATGGEVTEAGVIKGKAAYMAPEQALGQPIDKRIDLYAAGIVAWELLSGRRLFFGEQRDEVIPPLEGVSPAIAAVVHKALARDREQRFATARQMSEAFERAFEASGVRKAGREELGRFVAPLFEKDREWLQGRIRESVAAADPSTPPLHPLPTLEAHQPTISMRPAPQKKQRRRLPIAAAAAALALLGAAGYRLWPRAPKLRLCGSNTIGEALAPSLVEAFLKRKPGLDTSIENVHTSSGFKALAAGDCDVGMASRTMNDKEAQTLLELRAPATEHVIALDAIAVIVHPESRVRTLDTEQVKGIFTGAIRDWSEVGGVAGPIEVDALDPRSTTGDMFKEVALGGRDLAEGARRFDDSARLSDRVSSERGAVGFVGLAWVRSASAVAISERGLPGTLPSPLTVSSETYPLSRRLYLYTLPRPRAPAVTDFVTFALSNEGQRVVRQSGYVDLTVAAYDAGSCALRCTPEFAAATRGARPLTLDFRFREAAKTLDSRATRDLDRLVAYLRGAPPARLLLLGFGADQAESLEGARLVADELARRGVKAAVVEGFGATMPLSRRADAAGRQRNHRVEAWLADVPR